MQRRLLYLFLSLLLAHTYNYGQSKSTGTTGFEISENFRSKAIESGEKKQLLLSLNYYMQAINCMEAINSKPDKSSEYLYNLHNEAIAVADTISANYTSIDYNILMSRYVFPLYESTVSLSYQLYEKLKDPVYINRSLELSEKLRNLIMRESVKNAVISAVLKRNPELAATILNLTALTFVLRNKIDNETQKNKNDNTLQNKLNDSLMKIQLKNDSIMFALRKNINQYLPYIFTYEVDIKKIQAENSANNRCLIYYFFGDKNLFAYCINKDSYKFIKIQPDSIPAQSERLYQSLYKSDFSGFENSSHKLYAALLKPFESMFENSKTLIIIPDGLLNYLPFDCLLNDNPTEIKNFKTAAYLIRRYNIRTFSSLTACSNSLRNKETIKSKEISFFSPYFNQSLKDKYTKGKHAVDDTLYLSMSELRFSNHLIEQIKENYNVKEFCEGKASKKNFITELSAPGILHLASHTILNDTDLMASFVVFAQTANESPYLALSEMYGLTIKKNLLILGSCETGSGIFRKGTGNISISQAFNFAGCHNLIYTLWQVDDKATNEIFKNFYNEFLKSETAADALYKAKLRFLDECSPNEANPLYWAGIVYNGNEISLHKPHNLFYSALIAGGGIILLSVMFFIFRKNSGKRKRRKNKAT